MSPMSGMALSMRGHAGGVAMPGLIPPWLGGLGALVFCAVLVAHLRHVWMDCPMPRRCWHWGHVLMAASMVAMYLPTGLDPLHIPAVGWQAVFLSALGVLTVLGAYEFLCERRTVSALWLLVAGDMLAMLYMWSPGVSATPFSVVIGTFLLVEAGVWGADRAVSLDRPLGPSLWLMTGSGVLGFGAGAAVASRAAPRELRVSMVAMSLGMAYMILAMTLGS
jgi:hypothetical protein